MQLDIDAVPQPPSTSSNLERLRRLTTSDWLDHVEWQLIRKDGESIPLRAQSILDNRRRDRGPDAAVEADCDAAVECTTFRAAVNIPLLSPGDYALTASLGSLSSHSDFVVRTGDEPEWRDVYLREKAASAKSFNEYRTIALKRLAADPDRLDVLMDLLDRSLQAGTLEESNS